MLPARQILRHPVKIHRCFLERLFVSYRVSCIPPSPARGANCCNLSEQSAHMEEKRIKVAFCRIESLHQGKNKTSKWEKEPFKALR